jgi:hypothetical protein
VVNNEIMLGTEISRSFTKHNVFKTDDFVIGCMMARMFYPKNKKEYVDAMLTSVTRLKPKSSKFSFSSPEQFKYYYSDMYDPLKKLFKEFLFYDKLFRYGANHFGIEESLPRVVYGTAKDPGVFRILFMCCNSYAEFFVRFITEERLKNFDNMEKFMNAMKNMNNEFAKQSTPNFTYDKKSTAAKIVQYTNLDDSDSDDSYGDYSRNTCYSHANSIKTKNTMNKSSNGGNWSSRGDDDVSEVIYSDED